MTKTTSATTAIDELRFLSPGSGIVGGIATAYRQIHAIATAPQKLVELETHLLDVKAQLRDLEVQGKDHVSVTQLAVLQNQFTTFQTFVLGVFQQCHLQAGMAGRIQPRYLYLRVDRGVKRSLRYRIPWGQAVVLGRIPSDQLSASWFVDLTTQENAERVWCSRRHALISFPEGQLQLEDLNSSNGTFVNGRRICASQPTTLHPGDLVEIGTVSLVVEVG